MTVKNTKILGCLLAIVAALALSGCATTKGDWEEANRQGTAQAYARFLQKHPGAEQASHARRLLRELRAEEDWNNAQSVNTIYKYKRFLRKHAQSKQAKLAREHIEQLESEQDWEKAQKRNSLYQYEEYIKSHPQGQYVDRAKAQIDRLNEEAKERARQQKEKRKREQAAREAKEKAAREAFLKKIPNAVAEGAYVRAYRRKKGFLKSIGIAGEFIVQRILDISRQRGGNRIEPQPKHPLIVEFKETLGKADSVNGAVGEVPVSGNLALYANYTGQTSDPATEGIRKASPDIWVPLVDPRLHIVSGGFEAAGTFVVGKRSITFTDGGVMTQSTFERAFFMSSTRALVGDDVFVFNGKTWSTVTE